MPLVTANQFQLLPNTGAAIAGGLQLGSQIRGQFDQQRAANQQQDRQAQVEGLLQQASTGDANALNQLSGIAPGVAQQFQQFQGEQTRQAQLADERRTQSLVEGAVQLKSLPTDQERLNFLKGRKSDLTGKLPTNDTDELINLYETGQAAQANALIDSAVATGQQRGLIKAPVQQKAQPFQKGDKGLVFNPNTGTFSVDAVAKQRIDEVANKAKAVGGLNFKDRQSLNKDVTNIIKNTVGINNTAKDLSKLGELGTGPASIALVFKFMKALDPTSVVRESEFATAENSAGVPEGVRNMYNKMVSGERLGDKQIQQFVETAKVLSNTATQSSNEEISSLLNTFGDTIPEKFKQNLLKRIPKAFDTDGASKPEAQTFNSVVLGRSVSEQDIADTLQANPGLTREQLLQQLGVN